MKSAAQLEFKFRRIRRRGFRCGFARGLAQAIRAVESGMTPEELRLWGRTVRRWKDSAICPPTPPEAWHSANFERRRQRVLSDLQKLEAMQRAQMGESE
ncbi:MAG TPA: hypothetical protein VM008_01915 [Phycisphaerae bacterium]|nr:hypothetical protein [Phycisphaerae bacterium]